MDVKQFDSSNQAADARSRRDGSVSPSFPDGTTPSVKPGRRQRGRDEVEREQRQLLEKTRREIDAIASEFHCKLPRDQAARIGGVYARYSTRYQDSLSDQVRALFEAALREGIFIPREQVFFDLAVRGYKDRRPGLNALRQAIKDEKFSVFLAFATNRLFRKNYKALKFVEEELVEQGIRCIFVKSNIDTANGEQWRMTLQLFAAIDEASVGMYAEHVRAGHEGLFQRGMVITSLSLGYDGEVVPGEFTKLGRPRRRIVIDRESAPYVMKIYKWYVEDRLSLQGIARRLNDDPHAPSPPKSTTGVWTGKLIRQRLEDAQYRGWWEYGKTERKWLSKKDYARQVPRDEPLKAIQFEHLRIVSDELWYAVQKRRAQDGGDPGRKPRDGDRKSRPKLLRRIFRCPEHNRQLIVGGPHGHDLFCFLCKSVSAEKRPLYSHLNRALSVSITCEKLAGLVKGDEQLINEIIAACQRQADAIQQPNPKVELKLRATVEKLSRTIDFNRRNPGDTYEEQAETARVLKELRHERAEGQARISAMEAARDRAVEIPDATQVRALLCNLGDVLIEAANNKTDEELGAAREIVELLTGGRIDLYQMGERRSHGGWLQGRFQIRLLSLAVAKLSGERPDKDDDGIMVTIDYKHPPHSYAAEAEQAKELYGQGMMSKDIARELGCSPGKVTKLLNWWFETHGIPKPDPHARRAELRNRQAPPPMYQQIAGEVKRLWDQGLGVEEIARQIGHDKATVRKALAHWHRTRGLAVPNATVRRTQLVERTKALYDEGRTIQEIAKTVGRSRRCVSKMLKQWFVAHGEKMPDGRSRWHELRKAN